MWRTTTRFGGYLFHSNFSNVSLAGLDFTGADTTGASFENCDLTGATFSPNPTWSTSIQNRTDLTGATINFSQLGMNWSNINLTNTDIEGLPTDLSNSQAKLQAQGAILTNRNLANHNLQYCNFNNADLRGTNFTGSNLYKSTFTAALLQGDEDFVAASFSGSVVASCDFSGANLSGVNFSYANCLGVTFNSATIITNVNFSNAYLASVNFSNYANQMIQIGSFSGACLVNANFGQSNLSSTEGNRLSFSQACLQGANFSKANLSMADLSKAAIATAKWSLNVTYLNGWPLSAITIPLSNTNVTQGVEAATTTSTICPNGSSGPCDSTTYTPLPTLWSNIPPTFALKLEPC